MRYFFTPSLLAAVAVAGHVSNEPAMSVDKESLPRKDARGQSPPCWITRLVTSLCGPAGRAAACPGGCRAFRSLRQPGEASYGDREDRREDDQHHGEPLDALGCLREPGRLHDDPPPRISSCATDWLNPSAC